MDWRSVPEESWSAWRDAFEGGFDVRVQGPCPLCGQPGLRRYFGTPRIKPVTVDDLEYQGIGSGWEWCVVCRTFEHFSGLVPCSWAPPPLGIDEVFLRAIPGSLADLVEVWLQGGDPRGRFLVDRAEGGPFRELRD